MLADRGHDGDVTDADRSDSLRASNADREATVKRLQDAFAEGRLELSELDERTTQAYAAKTLGELRPLISDLPEPKPAPPAKPQERPRRPAPWIRYGIPPIVVVLFAVWLITLIASHGHMAMPPIWILFLVFWGMGGFGRRRRNRWYDEYNRRSQGYYDPRYRREDD